MLSMKSDSVGSRPLVAVLLLVFLLSVSGLAWASSEAGHGAASGREAPVAAGEVVNGGHGDAAGHGAGEAGGHGEGAHHGITHSQVMMFVWHCLSFSILALVLVKFLRKPISDGLKGRTESIKAGFEELEARRTEAERRYAEYERKLSNLDAEADRILKVFTEQGIAEKEKIISQAHEAAERIKAQAELYVEQELAKARAELRAEAADLAVKMAEELIVKNVTDQDHQKLISENLERVVSKN